jgi:hypothetical protein
MLIGFFLTEQPNHSLPVIGGRTVDVQKNVGTVDNNNSMALARERTILLHVGEDSANFCR